MSGATTDRHAWAPAKVGAGAQAPDTDRLEQALFEVKRVIVGQDRMVERVMVAVLARGHCLLEGVPGIAKTLTAETFATVVGGSFARLDGLLHGDTSACSRGREASRRRHGSMSPARTTSAAWTGT
jgi:hypothetical protein